MELNRMKECVILLPICPAWLEIAQFSPGAKTAPNGWRLQEVSLCRHRGVGPPVAQQRPSAGGLPATKPLFRQVACWPQASDLPAACGRKNGICTPLFYNFIHLCFILHFYWIIAFYMYICLVFHVHDTFTRLSNIFSDFVIADHQLLIFWFKIVEATTNIQRGNRQTDLHQRSSNKIQWSSR